MSEWVEKPWGRFRFVHKSDSLHVVEAEAGAGGRSSVHVHTYKTNAFYVSRGKLKVESLKVHGSLLCGDATLASEMQTFVVEAGKSVTVPPGVYHRFTAIEDSTFVEVYTPNMSSSPDDRKVDEDDIWRYESFEEVIRLW